MKLSVEIKPDFKGTISITDYTRGITPEEYISEEQDQEEGLISYHKFKYSQTCTINVLKYISVKEEQLLNVFYSPHIHESDSIRIPLDRDGFYAIYHLVLPTIEWLDVAKGDDLKHYNLIYVTDGHQIYKYYDGNLFVVNPIEVIEVNPYNTTISISNFEIFSIDWLKHCYASASRQIMDAYRGKCPTIDSTMKFNRDFLWMTINVIEYYLEWGMYSEAQMVLEDLRCHQFCPESTEISKDKKSPCGCRH